VQSGCCVFLENPGNLFDGAGVLKAVVARVHDQLGNCARVVCTGIRHLAVAPTRADSSAQLGNDRMPLDIRIDWQAVDGQEKGMFPRELIDARPESLSEGPCESVRTVAGQERCIGLLQWRRQPHESSPNVSDRTPRQRAPAMGRGDEDETPDFRYGLEDKRPMQKLAGFYRSGQVLEGAAGHEIPELRATV